MRVILWIYTDYYRMTFIDILPLILTMHSSVPHYHTMAWIEAIFHRNQSLFLDFFPF